MLESLLAAWLVVAAFVAGLGIIGWVIIGAIALIIFPFVENEKTTASFWLLAFLAVFIYAFVGWNILLEVWEHPVLASLSFVGYFAIGGIWSVFKWNRFNSKHKEKFDEALARFIKEWKNVATGSNQKDWLYDLGVATAERDTVRASVIAELNAGCVPQILVRKWHDSQPYVPRELSVTTKPAPRRFKKKITTWIAFWPWSALNYLLSDILKDLVDLVMRLLNGVYMWITNRHFGQVDERLMKDEH